MAEDAERAVGLYVIERGEASRSQTPQEKSSRRENTWAP